ncbi:MAG: flagellar basal body L-ring protein FlgH [Phycisphaerales bacterium]
MSKFTVATATLATLTCLAPCAAGQSLFRREAPPQVNSLGEPDPQAPLRDVSLLLIEAPKPKSFQLHDKVTILISEVSRQSANQKVDTKKDVSVSGQIRRLPDLMALLQAQLESDTGSPITGVDASAGNKFKGDGKYERSDRFTDRITATVIDVKPNGVLVLEARRTIRKDEEVQSLVLSGECRREDVTAQNTVMSNQLADMNLSVRNEGQVKEAAEKGLLSRVFDTVFNF